MLLNNDALECNISVSEKLMLEQDELLIKLIGNIKNCRELSVLENSDKDITITVKKVSTGEVVSKKSYRYDEKYTLLN